MTLKMSDITLNGVNLQDLWDQRNVLLRAANKFMSENIEKAFRLVDELIEDEFGEDGDTIREEKADEAHTLLQAVNLVSSATGAEYFFDRNDGEWEVTRSRELEDAFADIESEAVYQLVDYLQDMEGTVRDWNTSNC